MRESRFSIHDLSRVQSSASGELARLNMPFELGVDFGLSKCEADTSTSKNLLIIAEDKFLYQAALSDIAGWDIRAHGSDPQEAISQVRAWLQHHGLTKLPTSQIKGDYLSFQEWDYERLRDDGWSENDIQRRETSELLEAMRAWSDAGRSVTFP